MAELREMCEQHAKGPKRTRQTKTHQLSLLLAQMFPSSVAPSTSPPSDVCALVQLTSLPPPRLATLPNLDSGPALLSSVSASDAPPSLGRLGSDRRGGDAPFGGVPEAELLDEFDDELGPNGFPNEKLGDGSGPGTGGA